MKRIKCPGCGEETMPQVKLADGGANFSVRRVAVCMFCGAELPTEEAEEEREAKRKAGSVDALSALLGGAADEEAGGIKLELSEEESRFCRVCSHFVPHPFVCRCGLTGLPADPMGDCPRWEGLEANK